MRKMVTNCPRMFQPNEGGFSSVQMGNEMEGATVKDDLLGETRNQRAFHSLLVLILASFFLGVTDHYGVVYSSGTDPLIQQQQLSANDKTVGSEELFGSSMAISGDTALVGSPGPGV